MKPLLSGVLTGLMLQLAVGPIFFYILGITIDSDYINSLSAIVAVTLADYVYIALSLIGIGRFLQNDKVKQIFGSISSVILVLFGIVVLSNGLVFTNDVERMGVFAWTPMKSFISCLVLTMSSPFTIVFDKI